MKHIPIIFLLCLFSCKKEVIEPEQTIKYGCSENQKKLMDGFITSYLNKRIDLNAKGYDYAYTKARSNQNILRYKN